MSKHTLGEWSVDGHNLASVIRKTATGWETVATCPNANATWRGDARLIAAAPEMLEVLKALVDEQIDYARINNLGDATKNHNVYRAIAAIAKAEGQS